MKEMVAKGVKWLKGLSFRSGVTAAILCAICYGISFGQMLLPISIAAKGVLWVIFFGLAKTFQYSAVLILGKSGLQRLRTILPRRG